MPSLSEFSRRIRVIADNIGKNADVTTRKVALAVDQSVVISTPVDQGPARSNWLVSLNAPDDRVIEAYSPGQGGNTGDANTQAALAQGERVISGYQSGDEIHITNNLSYIGDLNDGSSRQAPANFVEIAVLEGAQAVGRAKLTRG